MSEVDPPGSSQAGGAEIAVFPTQRRIEPPAISFDRHELRQIMNLYGRMVAHGEWRDYAIDFLRDKAIFSIFRRSSEMPLYRIVKDPALARRQGAYAVLSPSGMILKRGHELARVLQAIDKPVMMVVQ
ncbi:DUF2794 domain-containing protein [Labrys wisconsinensis]|uniref:DUF2794 domain-containing protein n=1 Tax=Labrys wisconsinensis TaxID=425677 RepID=A0ABU0JDX9_9HYPH|nr:DUF2794 domain-containing protein [Labrys wisconsinensis]MDQ0472488.1 hypothetical protein [Labrys wisconsinensis]